MIEIMNSTTLTTEQKVNLLITLFALSMEEANKLVGYEKLGS
jgi:hypothetical protein